MSRANWLKGLVAPAVPGEAGYRTAMASTSSRTPLGMAVTWTQERAGNGAEKARA